MFQVSCQSIENFSRNSYFQVGGRHVRVRVRVLIIVCAVVLSTEKNRTNFSTHGILLCGGTKITRRFGHTSSRSLDASAIEHFVGRFKYLMGCLND